MARVLIVSVVGCAVAFGIGEATERPSLGVVAGGLAAFVAVRLASSGMYRRALPRRKVSRLVAGALLAVPYVAFLLVADGIDGALEPSSGAGLRATLVVALGLVSFGISHRLEAEPEPPPGVSDASAAVQREIDAATRGR